MNGVNHELREVRAEDLPAVIALLKDCALPVDDLDSVNLKHFELAADVEGRVIGLAGLEVAGSDALLRSIAVGPAWRGKGLGERLVSRRKETAKSAGANAVYLLTTTAADYFRRLGYSDIPRDKAPPAVSGHAQFRSLCPASAKCLWKHL